MTVNEAKELLLANACCDLDLCSKCPYNNSKKCGEIPFVLKPDRIYEAIDVITEEIQNEKYEIR